jgi:transitional endoplasmic reticulum ATPase
MAGKGILPEKYLLDGKYTIMLFIKTGSNAETYRVKGKDGRIYFLKLFNYGQLHRTSFSEDSDLLEIEILKKVHFVNLVSYVDSGEVNVDGGKFGYLVLDFIVGETLAEKVKRNPINSFYDLKIIVSGILEGLDYLHTLPKPVIHNELTPQNIMIDISGDSPVSKIIDFGYARFFHQSSKTYLREGLNLNFVAPECFNNIFSPQSDLFSVGALMYTIIYGLPPWHRDTSDFVRERKKVEDIIIESRSKRLRFPEMSEEWIDSDSSMEKILTKALQIRPEDRFQSASEFLNALKGEITLENLENSQMIKSDTTSNPKIKTQKARGKGFDAIAGMEELKEQLRVDIIDALNDPEEYARYGVTIPNGMLLYGPPGCGKTFFAKHFAEEVGFNFILATPSTLKSRYINATQENIAKMFEEAEKNAPTIIFIDEINELLPNRDSDAHEMAKSAVNEMLAQMDRTGEKGIFIIGATNYPDLIDPAMLRTGRLDKKFYLPPPDFEARKIMFELLLKDRPTDFGIDYDRLADLTKNFVSSDIDYLANEASRKALKLKLRISMPILEEVIGSARPSVSIAELEKFEAIRKKIDSDSSSNSGNRRKIGFKSYE